MISAQESELSHASHPKHKLKWLKEETSYECKGCKEPGSGPRFGCEPCKFNLHDDCTFASPYKSHDFYKSCVLKLFDSPQGEHARYCDACVGNIRGFAYHCEKGRNFHTCCKTGRDLHPRCSNLPLVTVVDGIILHLKQKVTGNCCLCGARKLGEGVTGWSYVSNCNTYHLHVACVSMKVKKECLLHGNNMEVLALRNRAPASLQQLVLQANSSRGGGRFGKMGKIIKLVLSFIISVLFGNPTAMVVGVVESLRP